MGKIIAISNQKGGVGKTTTSLNLAAGLGYLNNKVLLVDLDPQGNATQGIGASVGEDKLSVYNLLMEDYTVADIRKTLTSPPIDIVPANISLAGADLQMVRFEVGKEELLKNKLDQVKDEYDFIIIDCPPILNMLTVNALNVSDEVIIPIKIDKAAEKGFEMTLRNIKDMSESYDLDIAYKVLFTMVTRTNVDKLKIEEISNACDAGCVIQTHIRNQAKPIKEATYSQKSIINAKTGVGNDYVDLVNELLEEW